MYTVVGKILIVGFQYHITGNMLDIRHTGRCYYFERKTLAAKTTF